MVNYIFTFTGLSGLVRLLMSLSLMLISGCGINLPEIVGRSDLSFPTQKASTASYSSGGGYYKDDGPPGESVDIARIPDAVPQNEPLSRTGNNPYEVFGKQYVPIKSARGFKQTGYASWYGKKFHGKRTSSGEPYDMFAMTAAHPTLPLPTWIRVHNHENQREVVVKVNDRGPFLRERIVDLSYAAATKLDIVRKGTARVTITAVFSEDGAGETTSNVQEQASIQYLVQVGAFSNQANAVNLRLKLANLGLQLYPRSVSDATDGLFVVSIGPFDSRDEAEIVQQAIFSNIGKKGIIRSHH
ncbi:MAG: septal ring lytic transglycosylase RlpA family protein [Gammaproteobacteria bacterium]|nr:septal ring lytic transglycosylase RlpA family protein [Gammaproteobacteria bacterium]